MNSSYEFFLSTINSTISQIISFLPQLAAAIVFFIIGWIVARLVKASILKLLTAVGKSKTIRKTPLNDFFKEGEVGQRAEELVASIFYWILMLVVLHTTVSLLGLFTLSHLIEQIIGYIPRMVAAIMVFIFGVILAGLVEKLVKSAIRSIDDRSTKSTLIVGKISGYFVFSISSLAAISELGIAKEFILILFIGFVAAFSLGIALAIGLGAQGLIKEVLSDWYQHTKEEK